MKKAKRVLMIACMLALSIGGAHASLFRRRAADKTPAAVATPSALSLTAVDVETEPAPRLVLRTSGSPVYTTYSPQPDLFVVDVTASKDASVTIPASLPSSITSVKAEEVTEMGARVTRVTVQLAHPSVIQASAEGKSIILALPAAVPQVAEVPMGPSAAVTPAPEPPHVAAPEAPPSAPEPTVTTEGLPSRPATALKRIVTAGSGDALAVELATNGDVHYNAFKLEKPARLVIDLQGVNDKLVKNVIPVAGAPVRKIRVSQFKDAPEPVTRVVLDLNDSTSYHLAKNGDRLRISFGSNPAPVSIASTSSPTVTQEPAVPAVSESPKASQPARSAALDVPSQVPAIADNASAWKMPEPPSHHTRSVINAQATQTAPAPVTRTRRGGTGTSAATRATTSSPVVPASKAAEDVFNETPTTGQAMTPSGSSPALSGSLSGRTLTAGEKVYTGEPISLNLKDADIKDVIRTFAQLTGLNIAVDPQVSGSVTVDFVDVPWDQALEIILRQNNLSYVLEGNVMRIGTIDRLSSEATSSRKLAEEERLNVTLQTVSFKLSYARANEVAGLIRDIASPRAKIIVDGRTNQLIISEIPGYLQTIRSLIESVDVATRQVVIEARIVETSKTFIQQYGINFGFRTRLDPSLGTGTGLIFPNRVDAVGGPFNFGPGNPVLSFSLTDVLGTFTLDLALNALESEGLVRVISAPRIMTQDNVPAEIQSGFQIPYQTRVNFTTTIAYVDATLRLSVTPQITESGTVIMDITVQKNEPDTGLTIAGGSGVPLSTRQAKTRLMVRDGGTSVIAGIYQTKENKSETRLPILGNLPIIGNLFKTHDINNTHDELLIFITPRIVRST